MQTLRYWDYYGMTDTFTDLYDSANKGESFRFLYDIITSRENILLAYRTIKTNKGRRHREQMGKPSRTLFNYISIEFSKKNEKVYL